MGTKTKRPRISKRTREAAADLCQLSASNGHAYRGIASAVGIDASALRLAMQAWHAIPYRPQIDHDGEAEALLRCGWCPGDEVGHV